MNTKRRKPEPLAVERSAIPDAILLSAADRCDQAVTEMTDALGQMQEAKHLLLLHIPKQLARANKLLSDALEVIEYQQEQLDILRRPMLEKAKSSFDQTIDAVATAFAVPKSSILSEAKQPYIVNARYALCMLLREAGHTFPFIGLQVGRDHSSVLSAVRKGNDLEAKDAAFSASIIIARATLVSAP